MGGKYLVVSDLHLADVEDHADGWKIHKSSRFLIDDDFASLIRDFTGRKLGGGGVRTLVLNGDIFDFDIVTAMPAEPPWPVSAFERERGLNATEPKSVWKLEYILAQHPRFVVTLAEFVGQGHRVVYVIGNHDWEFHFAAVQRALVAAIERSAAERGLRVPEGALRFEPWFYYVENEIYAEHGNQFDHYSSFKDVLAPVIESREGPAIAVPMGNLSNRFMGTRMGFFNPHAADFILNFFRYLRHWLDHYAFTRRSLLGNWLVGSFLVVLMLVDMKKKTLLRRPDEAALAQLARRFNLSQATLAALARLQKPPIANRLYRVLREFWIDRLFMIVFMSGGAIALLALPVPLWIKVTVPLLVFPLVYFIYESLVQGDTIFTVEQQIPNSARAIADILPVRVVTFGHTHKPRLIPLGRSIFVDTGAWAPITESGRRDRLAPGFRNYLLVTFEDGEVRVKFDSWSAPEAPSELAASSANADREAAADTQRAAG